MAVAISQMNAFMIEVLRSKGMSNEDIFHNAQQKNYDAFAAVDTTFTYEELVKSVEEQEVELKKAIFNAYTIKFMTIRGVKRILQFKFQLAEEAYTEENNQFHLVKLLEKDLVELKRILAPNWKIMNEKQLDNGVIEFSILHQIDAA